MKAMGKRIVLIAAMQPANTDDGAPVYGTRVLVSLPHYNIKFV